MNGKLLYSSLSYLSNFVSSELKQFNVSSWELTLCSSVFCSKIETVVKGVNVKNFTSSWKDGLAFNAIIHKHLPGM